MFQLTSKKGGHHAQKIIFYGSFFVILLLPGFIIKALLPADQFIRIHKSYIVAVNKFDYIEGNTLAIANTYPIYWRNLAPGFF